ncbi:unnamed protein product [Pocillopora meandrina]|uniref:Set2 Rpb1 interacting domain-containing protein n=1 Tax=Pocillopora meandrina TaxID=46732 RepID=A0AAU9X2Q9_9CNID|nr:unnamed protein product [Pocillopora meandrina]
MYFRFRYFSPQLSNVVVNCLNPFFKVDCKSGRILNTDDFKYLARKLTHGILNKEMSHLKEDDSLQCNDCQNRNKRVH